MDLLPIHETIEENSEFENNPDCLYNLYMTIDFYKKVGFNPPWICYYAKIDNNLVGTAAFKGKPIDGKVEIAYQTFKAFQRQGVGTKMCGKLVEMSLKTDPLILICARTLPEKDYSTRILDNNGFELIGLVLDEDDGEVWEWHFKNNKQPIYLNEKVDC